MNRNRLACPASDPISLPEVVAAGECVGVVGAEFRRHQLEGLLMQRDRLAGPASARVRTAKIVSADQRVRVVGA